MQSGHDYGFIFDSTPNDFVSGELENVVFRCDRDCSPDLILLEGQSSLRNPSGPCGAEFLCSAMAKGVILQHMPGRNKSIYYQCEPANARCSRRFGVDQDLWIADPCFNTEFRGSGSGRVGRY